MRTTPALPCALLLTIAAGCTPEPVPPSMTREQLMDPKSCETCHPDHYREWSGSMHAYAGDDPVFLAMNRRGQRETNGALGSFCVKCHAPIALAEGATKDGLNLAQVPQQMKGVTCFFCHSVDEVQGTHDNPLHLAKDGVLRGGLASPMANTAHAAAYSPLHDRDRVESSALCGSCHDVVTPHGAAIERGFAEWQASVFSHVPGGASCSQCHMAQSTMEKPVANVTGAPPRRMHGHSFAGIDVALTPWPQADEQRKLVQDSLDSTLQSAVCVQRLGTSSQVQVVLDNVGAGHGFPSSAAADRRVWVEVVAKAKGAEVFSSGVVPPGTAVAELEDPDLWLMRDCLFDPQGRETHMFWEAASYETNALPALATFDVADPRYYQTHLQRTYPGPGRRMTGEPDEVRVRLHLQPIGLDVLDDLVASGDLDPAIREKMGEFLLGKAAELVWTPDGANETVIDRATGDVWSCTTNTNLNVRADRIDAPKHAKCGP